MTHAELLTLACEADRWVDALGAAGMFAVGMAVAVVAAVAVEFANRFGRRY